MSESTKIISYNGKSIKTKYISSVTDFGSIKYLDKEY